MGRGLQTRPPSQKPPRVPYAPGGFFFGLAPNEPAFLSRAPHLALAAASNGGCLGKGLFPSMAAVYYAIVHPTNYASNYTILHATEHTLWR